MLNKGARTKTLKKVDKFLMNLEDELDVDELMAENFDIHNFNPEFKIDENKVGNVVKDLSVKPLVKEADDYEIIHEDLPHIPFSLVCSGCRGAGKSVVAQQLLSFYNGHFDKVILLSPTAMLDRKWKLIFDKLDLPWIINETIFLTYREDIMKKLIKQLTKANKLKDFKDKVKVLMIFDDIITSLPKNVKKSVINKIFLNNRHLNLSIINITQSFMLLDSNLRKNCSQLCLWDTDNCAEEENYQTELSGKLGFTRKEKFMNFKRIFDFATKEKHSFLYINTHNRDKMFNKGFKENIDVEKILSQFSDGVKGFNKNKVKKNDLFSVNKLKKNVKGMTISKLKNIQEKKSLKPLFEKQKPNVDFIKNLLRKKFKEVDEEEFEVKENNKLLKNKPVIQEVERVGDDFGLCPCALDKIKDVGELCDNGINKLIRRLRLDETLPKSVNIKILKRISLKKLKEISRNP
jgi:hypothetical protein